MGSSYPSAASSNRDKPAPVRPGRSQRAVVASRNLHSGDAEAARRLHWKEAPLLVSELGAAPPGARGVAYSLHAGSAMQVRVIGLIVPADQVSVVKNGLVDSGVR